MWKKNRRLIRLEESFDQGEFDETSLVPPKEDYAKDEKYMKILKITRDTVRKQKNQNQIDDQQFSAFWRGIEKALVTPKPDKQPLWTVLSLSAAALLVAASIFTIFFGKAKPAVAQTVVEELATDLQGARVGWFSSEDGATVYVSFAEKDIW